MVNLECGPSGGPGTRQFGSDEQRQIDELGLGFGIGSSRHCSNSGNSRFHAANSHGIVFAVGIENSAGGTAQGFVTVFPGAAAKRPSRLLLIT